MDNQNSYYHYIKVNISSEDVVFELKGLMNKNYWYLGVLIKQGFYVYSLFKINIVNIMITINIIYAIALFVYMKFTKEVDYYTDFDLSDESYQNLKLNIAMFTNNYFPL